MIEGRYRVIRKIAEGGMATVYEAEDTRLERRVAIKIMHMQLAQGAHREQFVGTVPPRGQVRRGDREPTYRAGV